MATTKKAARWLVATALASWAAGAGLVACSDAGIMAPGTDASTDAATDAATEDAPDEGSAGDAAADSAGDAGRSADATADAAPDTGPDSAPDSGPAPDAGADASPDAGAPSLVALSIAAPSPPDGGPPPALLPPFSPDIHDYAVRCGPGSNAWTVSMTASQGASSLLLQPTASPSAPQQTLSVSLDEEQALVAAATDGAATVEYWVRCLPYDFPELEWSPHPEAGAPPPGYYLVGTALPTSGCYAMVLDPNGVPVWFVKAQPSGGWCVFDVDAPENETVSFDSVGDVPSAFELHALDPLATTYAVPAGDVNVDLHEMRLLANGDYLVISTPLQSGVDLTGLQLPLPDGGVETLSGPQTIQACDLLEYQPDGTIVWTWKATDHFDAVADSKSPMLSTYGPSNSLVIDPFHCNSIDVDPKSGNLLVSAREMDSVFYVEKATGQVLWKMGGAPASKDNATYVSVADPFELQHDARLQSDWSPSCNGGAGHISLFDDEVPGLPAPARAVVYDVVVGAGDAGASDGGCGVDAGGPPPGTATVAWQRPGAGPTLAMGSFRITPDGSRVIGWGLVPGLGFTEVDGEGNALLDLTFPDGNTTYRAIKVPMTAFDIDALRSTAGLP